MNAIAPTTTSASAGGLTPRVRAGRIILTFSLVVTPAAMTIFLFNGEHIANPAWHPHARYHVAELAGIGAAVSLLGLWLLWRRTSDHLSGIIAAAALAAAPLLAEFGVLLAPGASPIPDEARPNTIAVWGIQVPGNLLAFAFMLVLIGIGLTLSLHSARASESAGAQ